MSFVVQLCNRERSWRRVGRSADGGLRGTALQWPEPADPDWDRRVDCAAAADQEAAQRSWAILCPLTRYRRDPGPARVLLQHQAKTLTVADDPWNWRVDGRRESGVCGVYEARVLAPGKERMAGSSDFRRAFAVREGTTKPAPEERRTPAVVEPWQDPGHRIGRFPRRAQLAPSRHTAVVWA
jgi:hypothetical protein